MKLMKYALLNAKFFILIICGLIFAKTAEGDCTRDQAFDRMMESNKKSASYQARVFDLLHKDPAKFNIEQEKFKAFSTKLGSGGALLASQKYNEACKLYDSLDKEYLLTPDNGKTLTMKDLEKNGGQKKEGGCDLTQAAIAMSEMSSSFQKQFAAGKISQARSAEFTRATQPIGITMSENPSKACEMIKETSKNFGLSGN
jgi:hypothetical protein